MSTEDKYCDVLVVLDLGSGEVAIFVFISYVLLDMGIDWTLVYAKSSGVSPSYLIIYQNGRFTL